jgi:hypothetical protein
MNILFGGREPVGGRRRKRQGRGEYDGNILYAQMKTDKMKPIKKICKFKKGEELREEGKRVRRNTGMSIIKIHYIYVQKNIMQSLTLYN